ncbi:uncharacterized protein LOC143529156 [Bidens hawaiensis]|uniref:uncharacterized protein LOC143529156 n=1 Tax=Bidens hawaiensis TaxID=980011 RepID=UPI00404B0D29
MSTTLGPDLVSPLSEPERHLREGLRRRARKIAEVFENEVVEDDANPEVKEMADLNNQGRMDDFATPSLDGYGSGVTEPEITVSFKIKSSIIHMVENSVSFHGLLNEDPHSHVTHFLRLCATFKIQGCTDDAVRLRLFPFSLRGAALEWLEALPFGSITTWNQLVEQFLLQYFPPDKTARYRAKITGFRVDDDESLHAAWERFKGLLRKCPHHEAGLDQAAGGDFGRCTPNEALDVLERAAKKSFAYNPPRSIPSTKGVLHVDSNILVSAQLEALTKRFDQMQSDLAKSSSHCGVCDGKHQTSQCQQTMVVEDVDFSQNQKPPGFDRNPNYHNQPQNQSYQQKPQFQGLSSSGQSSGGSSVENLLTQLLAKIETSNKLAEQRNLKIDETLQRHNLELRNQKAFIQTIENQVGQIAQLLSARPQGSLPSNTEINPNAEAKVITLRSGRSTIPVDASVSTPKPIADEIETETPGEVQPRLIPKSTAQTSEPVRTYVPSIPYPGRLKKQKMEEQYWKFLELFKQLHINLSFLDALKEMPKYAKFLKEVLSNKKKLEEISCVTLNEECSAVLQNKLPKKMTDPGSFTIPCLIGSLSVSNTLADLGASINLMPYSVFAKLDLGEPKPTRMSIQLADRSVKYPRGIVENMLVKIDKFVFPVDFVILDMDEDENVPLILGRPFLAIA